MRLISFLSTLFYALMLCMLTLIILPVTLTVYMFESLTSFVNYIFHFEDSEDNEFEDSEDNEEDDCDYTKINY